MKMPQPDYHFVHTAGSMNDLLGLVNKAAAEGWTLAGTPFFKSDENEWYVAMSREKPTEEIKLKEPRKAAGKT